MIGPIVINHPAAIALDAWPARLEQAAHEHGPGPVTVLEQTESTQDAARHMNARPGHVVVAWRQTAGRGRLGRPWADTAEDGIAGTFVLSAAAPERLAIAAAVAVASALQPLLTPSIGIKWPNDIMVSARKLAGILIEQRDGAAFIGIGVNVRQHHWPDVLTQRAVSLAQLGSPVDRLEVLERLIATLPQAMAMSDEQLAAEFAHRDVLHGAEATLRSGERVVSGRIVRVDPMRGLAVRNAQGEHWLAAATTTLLAVDRPATAASIMLPRPEWPL